MFGEPNGDYEVHPNRIGQSFDGTPSEQHLVVPDPGMQWPGYPGSFCDEWRVGLDSNGQVVSYSFTLPIDESWLRDSLPAGQSMIAHAVRTR
jgi:hypothetical protein